MKRIGVGIRNEAIRLFFLGYSYDEIKKKTLIAKGTIANIIKEFRDGTLLEPPELVSYMDELRRVAIDLKRYQIEPKEINSYIRINNMFIEMQISLRQMKAILEVCKMIDVSGISRDVFLGATLELLDLTGASGKSYNELLRDYMSKIRELHRINGEIQTKKEELKELQHKTSKSEQHSDVISWHRKDGFHHRGNMPVTKILY